jgi:cytochrome c553
MMEYGYRFGSAWFDAEGDNWDMADYQIREAIEIQEVGETTRPANRERLTAFEDQFLVPLQNSIAARDKAAFESAYGAAITGCNSCHVATGHAYVVVAVPSFRPADYVQP